MESGYDANPDTENLAIGFDVFGSNNRVRRCCGTHAQSLIMKGGYASFSHNLLCPLFQFVRDLSRASSRSTISQISPGTTLILADEEPDLNEFFMREIPLALAVNARARWNTPTEAEKRALGFEPCGDFDPSCGPHLGRCVYRKLDSAIAVMKAAEQRMRRDASNPLNWAREGRVLVQRSVRSHIVVIAGVGLQNPA